MLVHARAQVLRSSSYIPFSVALQRARVELLGGPVLPEPTGRQNIKSEPDRCWAVDRAAAAANPLTTGTRPAPLLWLRAGMGAVRGQGAGHRASRRPSEVRHLKLNPGTPYRQASR